MNNKNKIISVSLILFCAIIYPIVVLSDIAPDPITGGKAVSSVGRESTEVRMVEEDVHVKVFKDDIVTVAVFNMYNDGRTDTMQVGFPYAYEKEFIEFHAYVNGDEVEVIDSVEENVGFKKLTVLWKLWEMIFEEAKAYEIRVEYRTHVYEMEHTLGWNHDYTSISLKEIDEIQSLTRSGLVSYYLQTGAAWKGVLNKCRVEIELVGKTDNNIKDYGPKDGKFTGSGMVWEYEDYEPTKSVSIRYYPNIHVDEIPSYLLSVLKKYPDDVHLASEIRREIRDNFRRLDIAMQISHEFLARWDGTIPQIMEYASGGRCRYMFKGEGLKFLTLLRMASILFREYEDQGNLDKASSIAQNVASICTAIIDSLDTCGNLPETNARLLLDTHELREKAIELIDTQ